MNPGKVFSLFHRTLGDKLANLYGRPTIILAINTNPISMKNRYTQ